MLLGELLDFDPSALLEAADRYDDAATVYEEVSASLQATASALRATWQGSAAKPAIARLEKQAHQAELAALPPRACGQAIHTGVSEIVSAREDAYLVKAWAEGLKFTVGDDGTITPTPSSYILGGGPVIADILARLGTYQLVGDIERAATADERIRTTIAYLSGLPIDDHLQLGPLDLSDDSIRNQVDTSAQGDVKNCYFLATLGALMKADPDFIRKKVQWDEDQQAYIVTIYDPTGQERQVVVHMSDVIVGGVQGPGRQPNLMSVYEKAYSETFGYEAMTYMGSTGAFAVIALTGKLPDSISLNPTMDELAQTVNGPPPGVATAGVAPWNDQGNVDPNKKLVSGHEYRISAVDTKNQTVTLKNPWGPGNRSGYPGTVTLTYDEYKKWVTGTTETRPPF